MTMLALAQAAPAAAVDDHERSWAHQALAQQYELGGPLELRNASWVGTHNSFNSKAEMGQTLSAQDSNQKLTIVDQLRLDMRSLELDVHWFPSPESGGFAPVVCHATEVHAGCTVEKPLGPVLDEIGGWLREHRDQALLLYLEDHLDNEQGYDTAAGVIDAKLGDILYAPQGSGCSALPLDLTRDAVRAAGKQVIIVSGCGIGPGWPSVAFDWSSHLEARPRGYTEYPDCGPDFTRAQYDSLLVRYFEDSTQLTANASRAGLASPDDGIDPTTAARMARCGVDLLGLDQLEAADARLDALVWSWAPEEPRPGAGDCAVLHVGADFPYGRWMAQPCKSRFRAACRSTAGEWIVPAPAVKADQAAALCRDAAAGVHAVPRTGYEAQLLREAMERAGARDAWIAYRRDSRGWAAR